MQTLRSLGSPCLTDVKLLLSVMPLSAVDISLDPSSAGSLGHSVTL